MERREYYQLMKALAAEKRQEYGLRTGFSLHEVRGIYRAEGIRIDSWPGKLRKIRAAYFVIDDKPHVMLNKAITPVQPRLFSLCHELKHHFVDRDALQRGQVFGCTELDYSSAPMIEIGAEVFAAEFIFPEAEFRKWVTASLCDKDCTAERVVHLMRNCPAIVSYTFLTKRLERMGLVSPDQFRGVQFKKLEERIYGVPVYRRRYRI